ncbi:MAG: hypothetical protein HQM15_09885 [Deltaproteobacteria bacterium]|nr:hypothetical protein [Deltaproteobacteria bacterium]
MQTKKIIFYCLLLFISNLIASFLFCKGVKALYPVFYLVLVVGGIGIVLSSVLSLLLKLLGASLGGFFDCLLVLVFQIIQVTLTFSLSYFIFRLPALYGVAFVASALLGLLAVCLLPKLPAFLQSIVSVVLGALALTISLRVGGVFAACFSSLLFLNLLPLGLKIVPEAQRFAFVKILSFWGLLFVGRAALQYYLLESGYDALGVVISNPYSFAALFAGISLPFIYSVCAREEKFPHLGSVFLLGLMIPLLLGFIFHVRPMAGFLMGLVCAAYWLGLSENQNEDFILVALLAFVTTGLGMTFFKESLSFTRGMSLAILSGGVVVISVYSALLYGVWKRRG